MTMPATVSDFLELVRRSGLLDSAALARLREEELPSEPFACAEALVQAKMLTAFQAKQILSGRYRGLILGPYHILRPIGKGGMGVVYLAEHPDLNRKVAIKVLNPAQAQDQLALERFYREARSAAALDHPNIVRLHDVNHLSGIHYLVMEYVEGLDLQSLTQQTGPLHYSQAANYIAQTAIGLQHAHERGFIHRDIKPSNLILAKDGTIKILDMGLTRSIANAKDDLTGKFEEEAVSGTADYISPEQALNASADQRSDIYSLGVTFYTLVTGEPPFGGTTSQKLTQHQLKTPPNLCEKRKIVPPELGQIVATMLAKNPEDRYQTAREVLAALGPWVSLPVEASSSLPGVNINTPLPFALTKQIEDAAPKSRQAKKPAQSAGFHTGWLVAGAVVVIGVAVLAAWLITGRDKKPTDPTPQTPSQNSGGTPTPTPNNPQKPTPVNPTPKPPTPESVVYRLNLASTKPFVQSNRGRTVEDPQVPAEAPGGWHTHSWLMDCTHEFIAEERDGKMALGIRLVAGPETGRPEAMLYGGGINVVPGREYIVRVVYQANGQFTTADVRVAPWRGEARRQLQVVGRLSSTNGQWNTTTFRFKNANTEKLQIEFHHYGPLGEGNELFIRELELIEG